VKRIVDKFVNNISVKTKFIVVLLFLITVVTVAVVAVRVVQVRNQVHTLIDDRLQGNANLAVGIFETVRTYTLWMLDAVATMPYVQKALMLDAHVVYENLQRNLASLFVSMNQMYDGAYAYANIFVFDSDLNLVVLACPTGESLDLSYHTFSENILMARKGYQFVSPVVRSQETGLMQFLFTQPVMIDGNFAGMAAVLGNTEGLAFFLRAPTHDYDSFINIADNTGTIFFSNRPAYIGRHVDDLGVYEAFGYIPLNTMFEHLSAITGIDKIAYITIDDRLGWMIVSFFDADAVENIARIIFFSLFPTVSGIILAAALMILIVHRSLQPLGILAANAKEVAKGNLAVSFDVSKNDEVGQVSKAFMEIVTALNTLQDNLKKSKSALTEDFRLGGAYDEMQRLKFDAESASKTKSDFLSKMSHEIRTPMNAILGMAELMLHEKLPDAARDQALTIKQSGDHLLSIINDILDLSKVESGKLELVNTAYFFHSTINDVVNIIKMRMTNPNLHFAVYMQRDIPNELFGDELRLRQILLNILSNALKYTKEGFFSLDITGVKVDDGETIMLTMAIKDTGIGIKPENMELLFSEFTQFDLEKNRNLEGTGLGLAITRNLIKLMDGEINVSSEYGKGSEFVICVPQKLCKEDRDSDNGVRPTSFEDKSVLLYGSTPIYTEYAARTIKDLGVDYFIISDDSELQCKLEEGNWGYVFAEEGLADTALHIVRTHNLDTKIVMMSDSYDTKGDSDITILIMPVYSFSVANVLSGRDANYSAHNKEIERFVAPDAKVLLVDDISTNLKVGEGLLKQYGIDLDMCASGKEAIDAVIAEDYDLVFMDHMMPEMDGVEAVKIIRSLAVSLGDRYADLPIVALTANAIVGAREMFLQNGFNDFLSKPIDSGNLNSILAKWIPKEKQRQASLDLGEAVEEILVNIDIKDVDTAKGILFSGGAVKNYLETLAIFRKDGLKKVDELWDCLESNNLSLYTTYVHALKSACANIGATKLSTEAKILEAAGIKQDLDFIAKNNGGFVDGLKELLANIDEVITANTEKPPGATFDSEILKTKLTKLKTALEDFDVLMIDEASDGLQDFTKFSDMGEALDDILQDAFLGEYTQAAAKVEELLMSFV